MYKKIFLLVMFFSGLLPAQSDFIIPITDYDYDSRNPSAMFLFPPTWDEGMFVFEIHEGDNSNIGLINYVVSADSFSVPVRITNSNSKNINPSIINYADTGKVILFQTDQNGSQDIAICREAVGSWIGPILLTNLPGDETNPSFPVTPSYENFDTLWVIYEKEGSIHLLSFKDSVTADKVIFESHDSLYYSDAASDNYGTFNFVAIEHSPSKQNAVYRYFNNETGYLSGIQTLVADGICSSPRIFYSNPYLGRGILTLEIKYPGLYQNIFYSENWPGAVNFLPWVDNPVGEISSLSYAPIDILTRNSNWLPHSYLLTKNDSTFIRLNYEENYPLIDTLLYTRVEGSNHYTGLMGVMEPYYIFYTIFEDSLNGHINLFARKQIVTVGNVETGNPLADGIILMQNYPNPFNPVTRMSFVIGKSSFVTLKIYDVLGNEVITLVNDVKSPGTYNIDFNAEHLSSGVYYYRLKAGNYTETKKMLLLK